MMITRFARPFLAMSQHVCRHAELFWKTPKDYLYSFTYPTDKKIEIRPYNPKLANTARIIARETTHALPGVAVHFVGSAGLGLSGQGDIDLLVTSSRTEFGSCVPVLAALFGAPRKTHRTFVEWEFMQDGHRVELTLIDPATKQFREQIVAFEILRRNVKLREEYEKLKEASRGASLREYQWRKLEFLNRIKAL